MVILCGICRVGLPSLAQKDVTDARAAQTFLCSPFCWVGSTSDEKLFNMTLMQYTDTALNVTFPILQDVLALRPFEQLYRYEEPATKATVGNKKK